MLAMISERTRKLVLAAALVSGVPSVVYAFLTHPALAQAQESQQSTVSSSTKRVGTVKTISGNAITLMTDSGSTATVVVQDSTSMVRVAPGQKDLKTAAPVTLQNIKVGDRLLVRGKFSADGESVIASSAIVMEAEDVAAKQEREREDWQKRGIGGLVNAVDAASGTITLTASALGASKTVTIHVSKDTIVRRYAPDSVKFDDAKPGTLDQIKAGDQLRARGTRSSDGAELAAEEIVSGAFRNIAGTVSSIDAANNTVNLIDLATKKAVILRITADSQLRKLPPMIAERIAARLKGESPGVGPGAATAGQRSGTDGKADDKPANGSDAGRHPGERADFQQMLNRMPAVTLADLQKGDVLMVVATEGTANSQPAAITLLTGVEPILAAASSERAAMLLSPWNLGDAGAEGAAAAQ